MSKFVMAVVAALSLGAAAEAATISGTVSFSQNFNVGLPALQVKALNLSNTGPQSFTSASFSTDLVNAGDSFSFDLFVARTMNSVFTAAQTTPRAFALTFATNVGTATLTGNTYGVTQGGSTFGVVDFDGPQTLSLGGGQSIVIDMADVFFNQGPAGTYTPGKAAGGVASASLTLVEVAPIPLPATGLMLLAGIGGLAMVRRRMQA